MSEPQNTGEIRNKRGQFLPGVSGNPAGKPLGAVSVVAKIKAKFASDPVYFDEWVDNLMADPKERRAIMEQLDGKPQQKVDVTSQGEKLTFNIVAYGNTNTPPLSAEAVPAPSTESAG